MNFIFKKLYESDVVVSNGKFKFKKLTTTSIVNISTQKFPLSLLLIPAGTYELSATAISEGLAESDYSNEETYIKN
jgi:hypothetical protein